MPTYTYTPEALRAARRCYELLSTWACGSGTLAVGPHTSSVGVPGDDSQANVLRENVDQQPSPTGKASSHLMEVHS